MLNIALWLLGALDVEKHILIQLVVFSEIEVVRRGDHVLGQLLLLGVLWKLAIESRIGAFIESELASPLLHGARVVAVKITGIGVTSLREVEPVVSGEWRQWSATAI